MTVVRAVRQYTRGYSRFVKFNMNQTYNLLLPNHFLFYEGRDVCSIM